MPLLRCLILLLSISIGAFACWQAETPLGTIHASVISGVMTLDGRPIRAAHLELHAATNGSLNRWDKTALQIAKTDADGGFDLGAQKPGRYVIVMNKPSGEHFPVELKEPSAILGAEQLDVRFTADFCLHLGIRSLSRPPTVFFRPDY